VTSLSLETDDTVRRAALDGDSQALEAVVRLYHDRVYRFGVRLCSDPFDADDAVQEAFFKLARRPEVVRHPQALGWLLEVVKNTCLRLARTVLRRQQLSQHSNEDGVSPIPPIDSESSLERQRLVELVRRAIASLGADQRAVVVLRDLEGLGGDEVCERLGLSAAAMKSRLHRGRQELRAFIERSEQETK
jgi:RNA polymerase sigma-70 factor, ECF subfamily